MSSIYLVQISILIIFTLQVFHLTASTTRLETHSYDEPLPSNQESVVTDLDNTLKHHQILDSINQSSFNEKEIENDDDDNESAVELLITDGQHQLNPSELSSHHHQKSPKRSMIFGKRVRGDVSHGSDNSNRLWAIPYRFGKRSTMPYRFGRRAAMHFRLGKKSVN